MTARCIGKDASCHHDHNDNTSSNKFLMNRILYVLLLVSVLTTVAACSETDDSSTEYDNWQQRNDEAFEAQYQRVADSVKANPERWMIIKSYAKSTTTEGEHTDYILAHVLSQATDHSDEVGASTLSSPLYTDSVRVHYRGNLIESESYSYTSESFGTKGYQFDTSWYGEYKPQSIVPSKLSVAGLVDGFTTALLHMHVGDRWEVMMPYNLGYKSTAQSSIPAYSTLIFDITLHSKTPAGESMPDFQ